MADVPFPPPLLPRDKYEGRRDATFARRLLRHLVERGILNEGSEMELNYPDWESIEAAEESAR